MKYHLAHSSIWSLALLSVISTSAIAAQSPGRLSGKSLHRLPKVQCSSPSDVTEPKCSTKTYKVFVTPIYGPPNGGVSPYLGCAAYFEYSELQVNSKKGGGGNGKSETAAVTWEIGYAGPKPGAAARFEAPGVVFTAKPGNGQPVPGTGSSTKFPSNSVTVQFSGHSGNGKKAYDHRPSASYRDDTFAPDEWDPCGAIDPTISNNPN